MGYVIEVNGGEVVMVGVIRQMVRWMCIVCVCDKVEGEILFVDVVTDWDLKEHARETCRR